MAQNNFHTPAENQEFVSSVGVAKSTMESWKLFLLALIAGAFIGFAGAGNVAVSYAVENPSIAALLGGCVFTIGLMMIVVAGGELFTGNILIIIAVLNGKAKWSGFLRNLLIVYAGNFIGACFVAWMTVTMGVPGRGNGAVAASIVAKGLSRFDLSFSASFISGLLCNILVVTAVWMSFAAKDVIGKFAAAFGPIMLFVLSGYEHIIANFYFLPAALFTAANPLYAEQVGQAAQRVSDFGWMSLPNSVIPVTLGNIVGGLMVALTYYLVYSKKK